MPLLVTTVSSQGTGSEVMQRTSVPMIGGMITASLFIIPGIYLLWKTRELKIK